MGVLNWSCYYVPTTHEVLKLGCWVETLPSLSLSHPHWNN